MKQQKNGGSSKEMVAGLAKSKKGWYKLLYKRIYFKEGDLK